MGSTFTRSTVWIAGDTLTAAALNGEFDNILNNLTPAGIDDESVSSTAMRATSDPYVGGTAQLATSLQAEIQQLRYLISQITGETYWYVDPDTDLATLASASTSQPLDATLTALAALGITQGSLITGTGTDAFSVLAKGTANQILRMNTGATAPEWATNITNLKVGSFTRDLEAASGDVAYTSVGFKPKVVIFLCVYNSWGIGFDDGTTHECVWTFAGGNYVPLTYSIIMVYAGGMYQTALIKSLDADGFTLSWTRVSTPVGVTTILYLAIG
jgi:hypothetical protein